MTSLAKLNVLETTPSNIPGVQNATPGPLVTDTRAKLRIAELTCELVAPSALSAARILVAIKTSHLER